jgi:hypothetical protein
MDKRKTEIICQLDVCDDIFVTAQHFKGEILVHIRIYKQGENGENVPMKKGTTIPIHRLKTSLTPLKKQTMLSRGLKGTKSSTFGLILEPTGV